MTVRESVRIKHCQTKCLSSRAFCVAKLGSLDLNPAISCFRLITDLGANMLAFTITIGPDEQCFGVLGLFPNILRNWELVLVKT